MEIKRVKLFTNSSSESLELAASLEKLLLENKIELVEKEYQLAIAIGGDGTFLQMVRTTNFDSDILYIGINTGHLGFLQEIKKSDIKLFVDRLLKKEYKIDEIGVQTTKIETPMNIIEYSSLNEIFIKNEDLSTLKLQILIDEELLERYVGDGILICTSIGSTAHNLSYGGAIIDSDLHTLQITTQGAINSTSYRNVPNSIIVPQNKKITIFPCENNHLNVRVDGENHFLEVSKIETFVRNAKIHFLRMNDYPLTKRIHEKFIEK